MENHPRERILCWNGEYIKTNEFYDKLNLEMLEEFYKNNTNPNPTYQASKELLKEPKAKPVEKSCTRSLYYTLGKTLLLESFPIAFIDDGSCQSSKEAKDYLNSIVRLLHKMNRGKNMEELYEIVDKDELFDVTMWLSEKMGEILRLEKSKEEC